MLTQYLLVCLTKTVMILELFQLFRKRKLLRVVQDRIENLRLNTPIENYPSQFVFLQLGSLPTKIGLSYGQLPIKLNSLATCISGIILVEWHTVFVLIIFSSYASAAAVPDLQTDPALILLGARESTTVTSHKGCLPTDHGTSFKPSGRFLSILQKCVALKQKECE